MITAPVQRGAILLEILLSMTLFLLMSLAIMTAMGQGRRSLEGTLLLQQAADHARTAMARIEAGLDEPARMSGPIEPWSDEDVALTDAPDETGWMLEVDTSPSQFTGLTLFEVVAYREDLVTGDRDASFSLKQLVRLSDFASDTVGEDDAIIGASRSSGGRP